MIKAHQQQLHILLEYCCDLSKTWSYSTNYWYKTERQIRYLPYYTYNNKCLATHSLNLDDGNIFLKITCVAVFSKVCIRPFSNAFWCYHCHFTPFVPLFPSSLNFFVWCCKPSKRHIEPILKACEQQHWTVFWVTLCI